MENSNRDRSPHAAVEEIRPISRSGMPQITAREQAAIRLLRPMLSLAGSDSEYLRAERSRMKEDSGGFREIGERPRFSFQDRTANGRRFRA
jgi:hypothetical protein